MQSSSQNDRVLNVTWSIMPRVDPNVQRFFYRLVNHNYAFFSSMLSRHKLTEVRNVLASLYGDSLNLVELNWCGMRHTLVVVAYSPSHFCNESAVADMVHYTRRATLTTHHGSIVTPPPRC